MMNNILFLTDFSKNANNAIAYALQLFSGETCKFTVLNVQKVSKYITSDLIASPKKTVYDAVIKNPKKSVEVLVNDLSKKYIKEDFTFEGICDFDSFISAVKQVVEIKQIDLIIMGTNGVSGIKEAVFGSNTIQVIKKIDLPILVVPENYTFAKPTSVLFINETEIKTEGTILKPLSFIVTKFNSQLDIMTINDEIKKDKSDDLKVFFKETDLNFYKVNNMSIENAIEQFNIKNNIQLVSKIINTETFFERIFSASTTTNITYASNIPILFL